MRLSEHLGQCMNCFICRGYDTRRTVVGEIQGDDGVSGGEPSESFEAPDCGA